MKVLFAGPSCARRLAELRVNPAFTLRGPAAYGDVARATLQGATAIGIVDGRFEDTRAVWHKEILFALSEGVAVAGAASMGALRAAECAGFGMTGIGEVFRRYMTGEFEDDADVAQLHGPAELGYLALSEPLANMVVTLEKMLEAGAIDSAELAALVAAARALHYKQRSYALLFKGAGLASGRADFLATWAEAHAIDQKSLDAACLVDWLSAAPNRRSASPGFTLSKTSQWLALLSEIWAGGGDKDSAAARRAMA